MRPDDLGRGGRRGREDSVQRHGKARVARTSRRWTRCSTDAFDEIDEACRAERTAWPACPAGFQDVDDLFHGFRGGDLVILAARPGVGKTSFALNLAANAAQAGRDRGVLLSGNERGASWCSVCCAPRRASTCRSCAPGIMQESDWGAIADASNTLSKLDMYIDDTPVALDSGVARQGSPRVARR